MQRQGLVGLVAGRADLAGGGDGSHLYRSEWSQYACVVVAAIAGEGRREPQRFVRGRFIYSGGIGSLDDLRGLAALRQVNLAGVIVGKALYEGRFTIPEGQAALDLR